MGRQTEGQEEPPLKPPLNLLALIQGHDVPSSRYRVLQWLPAWREAGYEADVLPLDVLDVDITDATRRARKADIVLFHRKRVSPRRVRALLAGGARAVYDVDDAVMFRDALKPGRARSWLRRRRYAAMTRAMDRVIVGNRYIAEHTPVDPAQVTILPTCLDTAHYGDTLVPRNPDAPPTLVWIGDTGSRHYLEARRAELEAVGRRVPGARLKIISSHFMELEHLEVVRVPWSAEREVDELRDADVGLMPLGSDPWSRGKCALKFLQYLAVGRPAVVTPVGMNADILEAAPCGRPATTPEDWVEACVALLTDREAAARAGRAGFDLVRERYSLAARSADWVAAVSGTPA